MGGVDGADVSGALIGYGIAHGVEYGGFVVGVYRAFNQIHRLHHMGVAAHDDVHAQITELLGDVGLILVGGELVFHTPVDIEHGCLRSGILHFLQVGFHLGIEGRQVVVGEVIAQARFADGGVSVELGAAVGAYTGGVGVAQQTDFDAVHILNGPFLLVRGQIGAQGFQACLPNHLQCALEAHKGGIVAVVVGGEQHIKPRVLQSVHNGIGAVEIGKTGVLIAVVGAGQGGFQVGNRKIRGGNLIGYKAENGIKVVAVGAGTGPDYRHMHQNVAGGENGGGGHLMLRLRHGCGGLRLRLCGGRLRGFLRGDGGRLRGGGRLGGGDGNAQPDGAGIENQQHNDQRDQYTDNGRALFFTIEKGHVFPP